MACDCPRCVQVRRQEQLQVVREVRLSRNSLNVLDHLISQSLATLRVLNGASGEERNRRRPRLMLQMRVINRCLEMQRYWLSRLQVAQTGTPDDGYTSD